MFYTDTIWQNDILGDGFEMRQETLPNNENSKKFTITLIPQHYYKYNFLSS